MLRLALLLALAAGPALAACPPNPERTERQDALMEAIREAPNAEAARQLTNEIWEIWATAPDARAQALLDRGMEARAAYDFAAAAAAFDELVAYCPDYAEGYNQRAFVAFLQQDYGAAVTDLEVALDRAPDHFAARAGLALSLMGLGRTAVAQAMLREALRLNPWLPERAMLLEPLGEEL